MEIARGRLTPEIDLRWREFGFGEWEGLRVDEVEAGVNARAYAPPGGETFDALRRRVAEAIEDVRRSDLRSVLIVTHAGPLHAMLDALFGEVQVVFAPASITQLKLGPVDVELLSLGISVRQYAEFKQANTSEQD